MERKERKQEGSKGGTPASILLLQREKKGKWDWSPMCEWNTIPTNWSSKTLPGVIQKNVDSFNFALLPISLVMCCEKTHLKGVKLEIQKDASSPADHRNVTHPVSVHLSAPQLPTPIPIIPPGFLVCVHLSPLSFVDRAATRGIQQGGDKPYYFNPQSPCLNISHAQLHMQPNQYAPSASIVVLH